MLSYSRSQVFLHFEQVAYVPIVALCPDVSLILNSNQLRRDTYPLGVLPRATLEDIVHAEFVSDLVERFVSMLVPHHRGSGDHAQFLRIELSQIGDGFLG